MAPELQVTDIEKRCQQYSVDFEDIKRCSLEITCDDFKACVLEFRQHADEKRRLLRLQDYVEERRDAETDGRYDDADAACNNLRADPDPIPDELSTCDSLPERAHDALKAKIQLLRDLPRSRFGHLSQCATYTRWANRISVQAAHEAKTLCREAEASIDVFELVQEVRQRIAERDYRVPPHCKTVISRLTELNTPWAKKLTPVVVERCYITLGNHVLDQHVTGQCSADTRRILQAAAADPIRVGKPLKKRIRRVEDDCR